MEKIEKRGQDFALMTPLDVGDFYARYYGYLAGANQQRAIDIQILKNELEVVLGLYVGDYNDRQIIINTVVKAMEE